MRRSASSFSVRGPDGRGVLASRGKSGLHGNTAPDNVRRGRPQGKCHRKQTAFLDLKQRMAGRMASSSAERGRPKGQARVKGCGKSAPRCRQRRRHGKPHREQDQVGTAGLSGPGALPRRRPGRSREAPGDGRPRGMVIPRASGDRTRLTGRLAFSAVPSPFPSRPMTGAAELLCLDCERKENKL